jgi:hypothetical protein
MESYLRVLVHPAGAPPSELSRRLWKVGFVPVQGNYDFVYEWSGEPTPEELVELTEEVREALDGCHVLFEMETVDAGALLDESPSKE